MRSGRIVAAAAIVLAGCGRIGFGLGGGAASSDAAATSDGSAGSPDGADSGALDPSLLVWLQMETAPSAAIDSSPAHNTVACTGDGCPTSTAGVYGSGYEFVPSQQLVDSAKVPGPPFTVALWIRLDAFPTDYACPVCQPFGGGDADSFCLCVTSAGAANYFSTQAGDFDRLIGTKTMALHAWHHLAMRYDGATKEGFFDGAADGSDAIGMDFDTDHPVYVGDDFDGTPEFPTSGTIDDLRIYTRELTDPELATLATP